MAAYNTVNTLQLTFNTHVMGVRNPVSKASDIGLVQATTIPPKIEFPPVINQICNEMAQAYIFELGEKFKPLVLACEAKIRFSAAKGIEILDSTDPQFMKIPFQKCSEVQKKAMGSTTLKLQIKGHNALTSAGGITTGPLRFPQMLRYIFEIIPDEIRKSDKIDVCIVGPGLDVIDKTMPTVPQAVELISLFPKAKFVLLDNSPEVLDRLNKYRLLKMLPYDPLTLRMRAMKVDNLNRKNQYLAPECYTKVFASMAATLGDLVSFPTEAKAMLVEHKGVIDRIMLKLAQEKFEVRAFDIITSEFPPKEQFDVIVATMCIGVVLSDSNGKITRKDDLEKLAKFISALKVGGSLYIDFVSFIQIGRKLSDKNEQLEKLVGHKLSISVVPMNDFLPSQKDQVGLIECFSLYGDPTISTLSTASIVVVTKVS